jgi:protein-S-isoprenylcysteine O-methyltransferase Ste14
MTLSQYQSLRRLALAVLIGVAFVLLLVVRSSYGGEFHEYVEAFGMGLIVAGILGRMWCTLYIGGRKSAEVVTTGPYSITRNPLYVFSSLAAAGVGAQTGSVLLAFLFMLGCALSFQIVIRREERFLAAEFGAPYQAYMAAVPRFWPRLSLFRDSADVTVRTRLLYRTLTDGLIFFVAVPAFEFVEGLQNSGILPVLLHMP